MLDLAGGGVMHGEAGNDTNQGGQIDAQDAFTDIDPSIGGLALHTWDDTLVIDHTQALQYADLLII